MSRRPALNFPGAWINGHAYSFASIEIEFEGKLLLGALSINYSDSLAAGHIYGSEPNRAGRTTGRRALSASMELLKLDWDSFRDILGQSFGRKSFNINVMYADYRAPVTRDNLIGCRITKVDAENHNSSDPSAIRLDLDPTDILWGSKEYSLDLRAT